MKSKDRKIIKITSSFLLAFSLFFLTSFFNNAYAAIGALTEASCTNNGGTYQVRAKGWACDGNRNQTDMNYQNLYVKVKAFDNNDTSDYYNKTELIRSTDILATGNQASLDNCESVNHSFDITVDLPSPGKNYGAVKAWTTKYGNGTDILASDRVEMGPLIFSCQGTVTSEINNATVVYPDNPNNTSSFSWNTGNDFCGIKTIDWIRDFRPNTVYGTNQSRLPGYNPTAHCEWAEGVGDYYSPDSTCPVSTTKLNTAGQSFYPSGGSNSTFYSSSAKYHVVGANVANARTPYKDSITCVTDSCMYDYGATYRMGLHTFDSSSNQPGGSIVGTGVMLASDNWRPLAGNIYYSMDSKDGRGVHGLFGYLGANSYWFGANEMAFWKIYNPLGTPSNQCYTQPINVNNPYNYSSGKAFFGEYNETSGVQNWDTGNLTWHNNMSASRDNVDMAALTIWSKKIDAKNCSITAPTSVVVGSAFTPTVTLTNRGDYAWTKADNYRLGSKNPRDNTTWGFGRVELGSGESIAPGSSKTFSPSATAPSTAGTYSFDWQMVKEGESWFGDVCTRSIVVANPAAAISGITVTEETTGQSAPFLGTAKTSGLTVGAGTNWINPMKIQLNSSVSSGSIKFYAVAFYNQTLGRATSLETVRGWIEGDATRGFLLGYAASNCANTATDCPVDSSGTSFTAGTHYVYVKGSGWSAVSNTYKDVFLMGTSGVTIFSAKGLNGGPNPIWAINLDKNFGSKNMYTGAFVVTSGNVVSFTNNIAI